MIAEANHLCTKSLNWSMIEKMYAFHLNSYCISRKNNV
jgi:hypothetical protein